MSTSTSTSTETLGQWLAHWEAWHAERRNIDRYCWGDIDYEDLTREEQARLEQEIQRYEQELEDCTRGQWDYFGC